MSSFVTFCVNIRQQFYQPTEEVQTTMTIETMTREFPTTIFDYQIPVRSSV